MSLGHLPRSGDSEHEVYSQKVSLKLRFIDHRHLRRFRSPPPPPQITHRRLVKPERVLVVVQCRICRGKEVPRLAGIERQAMQQVSESYRKWLARGLITRVAVERTPETRIKSQFLLVFQLVPVQFRAALTENGPLSENLPYAERWRLKSPLPPAHGGDG